MLAVHVSRKCGDLRIMEDPENEWNQIPENARGAWGEEGKLWRWHLFQTTPQGVGPGSSLGEPKEGVGRQDPSDSAVGGKRCSCFGKQVGSFSDVSTESCRMAQQFHS